MKRSPMKPIGKITRKWISFRKQWFVDNPPPYRCGICGDSVHEDQMVLDHILPRSNRPDLRFDPSNIQPAHFWCNSIKGSSHPPAQGGI